MVFHDVCPPLEKWGKNLVEPDGKYRKYCGKFCCERRHNFKTKHFCSEESNLKSDYEVQVTRAFILKRVFPKC